MARNRYLEQHGAVAELFQEVVRILIGRQVLQALEEVLPTEVPITVAPGQEHGLLAL
jgi:hypothetical protein